MKLDLSNMKLWKKRAVFTHMLYSKLLPKMAESGLIPTLDFVKRCPDCKIGKLGAKSFHAQGLAVDINLYREDGTYLSTGIEHKAFGEYWESIGGTWGGRWNDGNHYSLGEGE